MEIKLKHREIFEALDGLMGINTSMIFAEVHEFNRLRDEAGERSPWSPEMMLEFGKLLGAVSRLQSAFK
jgi:hypothetical protein